MLLGSSTTDSSPLPVPVQLVCTGAIAAGVPSSGGRPGGVLLCLISPLLAQRPARSPAPPLALPPAPRPSPLPGAADPHFCWRPIASAAPCGRPPSPACGGCPASVLLFSSSTSPRSAASIPAVVLANPCTELPLAAVAVQRCPAARTPDRVPPTMLWLLLAQCPRAVSI